MASRPPTESPAQRSGSGWTLLAAFGGFFMASLMLLMLPIGYLGIVFVVGLLLFSVVCVLHYLVWGIWMSRVLRADENQAGPEGDHSGSSDG